MRARGRDPQPDRLEQRRKRPAQRGDLLPRLADVRADLRSGLDHRLHHFGLDLLAEARPRRGKQCRAVALELPLAVDDLELLLDADGEARHISLPLAASTI